MNHKKLQQLLSAYADGYANESERTVMLSHLETCTECRKFLEELKQLHTGIREAADVHLPHTFSANVLASIQNAEERKMPWMGVEPSARNTVFVLAAIVVLLFSTTVLFGNRHEFTAQHLLNAGVNDSLANTVLMHQSELSRDDVMLAVMSK